jgi:Mo-dependent nitrogenase C-terminus
MNKLTAHNVVTALLNLIRHRLESVEINDKGIARSLCKIIPASCPFEREIKLGNRRILYIPPLCKLNPFYEQLVMLRFRSLTYLAEEWGEV